MEELQPDDGTDPPPTGPTRQVKQEPIEHDLEVGNNSMDNSNDASSELNEANGGMANPPVAAVEIKEEPLDDDTAGPSNGPRKFPNNDIDRELYCVCNKRGCTDFMVACEMCDIWFHDICVDMDDEIGDYIMQFYCNPCISLHEGLKCKWRPNFKAFMKKREQAKKAANTRKAKREMEMALRLSMGEVPKQRKKRVDKKIYPPRSGRCSECIQCFKGEDCGKCYYCETGSARCITIFCIMVNEDPCIPTLPGKTPPKKIKEEPKEEINEEVTPKPKGAAKRKYTKRKSSGKSGAESDDDELFLSESTSTRAIIKKELSYKEVQQLDETPKKRGRKPGWKKDVDGKEAKEKREKGVDENDEPPAKKARKPRAKKATKNDAKKEEKGIIRVGMGAEFTKLNGPEDMQFERPGYNTTLKERLDLAAAAHAHHLVSNGLAIKEKKGQTCINIGCGNEARPLEKYCSEECGMAFAQRMLMGSGLIPKAVSSIPPPRSPIIDVVDEDPKEEKMSLVDRLAEHEAEIMRRAMALNEKTPMTEMDKEEKVKENVESIHRATAERARLQEEEQREREAREEKERVRKEKKKLADQRRRERKAAEAEQQRLSGGHFPVGSENTLDNAFLKLLLQSQIVRPQPVYPTFTYPYPTLGNYNPYFDPNAYLLNSFNPLMNPLLPSLPAQPKFSSPNTAMTDHNDYLGMSLLPLAHNSPPTPSTLSNPSPANPSPVTNHSPPEMDIAQVLSRMANSSVQSFPLM